MKKSKWVLMSGDYEGSQPYAIFERREDCPVDATGDLVEVEFFDGPVVGVKSAIGRVEARWDGKTLDVKPSVEVHESWPWYSDGKDEGSIVPPQAKTDHVDQLAWARGSEEFVRARVDEYVREFRSIPDIVWIKLQETAVVLDQERKRKIAEQERLTAEMVAKVREMAACPECRKVTGMTSAGAMPCQKHREAGYPMRPISVFGLNP